MIRRPPRSTQSRSSAASDVYKRQVPYGSVYQSCTDTGQSSDPSSLVGSRRAKTGFQRSSVGTRYGPMGPNESGTCTGFEAFASVARGAGCSNCLTNAFASWTIKRILITDYDRCFASAFIAQHQHSSHWLSSGVLPVSKIVVPCPVVCKAIWQKTHMNIWVYH